jgi:hypothetical protein
MSQERTLSEAIQLSTRQLQGLAVGLAIVVALVHMFHPSRGVRRLTLLLSADPGLLLVQPRTIAFVASGFLLLVGASALALGVSSRGLYAAGMALMATYVLGYIGWHLSGHGAFLPERQASPHTHLGPVEYVTAHVTVDPIAAGALVAEVLLFLVSASLFWRQQPGDYPSPSD